MVDWEIIHKVLIAIDDAGLIKIPHQIDGEIKKITAEGEPEKFIKLIGESALNVAATFRQSWESEHRLVTELKEKLYHREEELKGWKSRALIAECELMKGR